MTTTGVRWLQARSMPARIIDILETTGETLTGEALRAELSIRFRHSADLGTVRRACSRLVEKGLVESSWLEQDDERGYPIRVYRVP